MLFRLSGVPLSMPSSLDIPANKQLIISSRTCMIQNRSSTIAGPNEEISDGGGEYMVNLMQPISHFPHGFHAHMTQHALRDLPDATHLPCGESEEELQDVLPCGGDLILTIRFIHVGTDLRQEEVVGESGGTSESTGLSCDLHSDLLEDFIGHFPLKK